jgi:ParB family chromosome partitioning protein
VAVLTQKPGGALAVEIREPVDVAAVEKLLKQLLKL